MSYQATVYNVMIASPSDVPEERQIAREVIYEWNAVHSEEQEIVLLPVGWETHASPRMGERPQEVINKQVLETADLLIAVFWTRLGSPTGRSANGTVEEIEEHINSNNPAMIYFSTAPVALNSVDREQYDALLNFRDECKDRGLIEEYDSSVEFREKLTRQLAQVVIRDIVSSELTKGEVSGGVDPLSHSANTLNSTAHELSNFARDLLKEASQDRHGQILRAKTAAGTSIQTNGKNLAKDANPRTLAAWEGALRDLGERGFVIARGYKGEVFEVTDKGYEIADYLREQA